MTPRIFIDSSVLFSAANSAKGHSRDLILMSLSGQIKIILSKYVLEETRRNLAQLKRPPMDEFESFLVNAGLEIIEINKQAVLDAGKLIVLKDAPIIAAAKIAKVDMLVSLDKRHILDHPELEAYIQAFIVTPAQAFQKIEDNYMNFNDYQFKSRTTAKYPIIGHPVIYPTLGLVNEAGEVAGKIKKVFRDKDGQISAETRETLKAELGDVLWYLAQVATELDLSLDEIAEYNIAKLMDRLERGKIRGDGDHR